MTARGADSANDLADANDDTAHLSTGRTLPHVGYLTGEDARYEHALASIIMPEDQARWSLFFRSVLLGIGLLTAVWLATIRIDEYKLTKSKQGAGYGKTTAMSVIALAMRRNLGRVFCTGPTHVAVTNLARRIDSVSLTVCERYNKDLPECVHRAERAFVVRGYKIRQELHALRNLLRDPSLGDAAGPRRFGIQPTAWRLPLSLAYWTLVLLRSPAVGGRVIDANDKRALIQMQRDVDNHSALSDLRELATGRIDWDDWDAQNSLPENTIESLMSAIVAIADFVCTTPAARAKVLQYKNWSQGAGAIVIDEAANMGRGDLACVWGNSLKPILLSGDPEQLPPTVMTNEHSKDAAGNVHNQFCLDGRISAMTAIMASGLPVYRMRVHQRMARGLFDIVGNVIYPDLPVKYADYCDISNPCFAIGHKLESHLQEQYPDLCSPEEGKFAPAFLHCDDAFVQVTATKSKRSTDQVRIALDFAVKFVVEKSVDPASVTILSPYEANVTLIDGLRKKDRYAALHGMPRSSTIDGFQGQENDIVIVVMGTKAVHPGPGFTKDSKRLNVLLTRQRSGLVIIGDIHVAGRMKQQDWGKRAPSQADTESETPAPKFVVPTFTASGEQPGPTVTMKTSKAPAMAKIHHLLWSSGRVVTVSVKKGPAVEEVDEMVLDPVEEAGAMVLDPEEEEMSGTEFGEIQD